MFLDLYMTESEVTNRLTKIMGGSVTFWFNDISVIAIGKFAEFVTLKGNAATLIMGVYMKDINDTFDNRNIRKSIQ